MKAKNKQDKVDEVSSAKGRAGEPMDMFFTEYMPMAFKCILQFFLEPKNECGSLHRESTICHQNDGFGGEQNKYNGHFCWPDCRQSPVQIFSAPLDKQILDLILDAQTLKECPIWTDFLLAIDDNLFEFMASKNKDEHFVAENEEDHDLETSLFNTIYSIINEAAERYGDDYYDDSDDSKYLKINVSLGYIHTIASSGKLRACLTPSYSGSTAFTYTDPRYTTFWSIDSKSSTMGMVTRGIHRFRHSPNAATRLRLLLEIYCRAGYPAE
ncbi:hypothetical protein B0H14DRAFT_2652493 [Mycena olivaceomarginata]|nr:hypothetical protein B0H14DRAFT_2652493 [Mycena olivaceomarginata]